MSRSSPLFLNGIFSKLEELSRLGKIQEIAGSLNDLSSTKINPDDVPDDVSSFDVKISQILNIAVANDVFDEVKGCLETLAYSSLGKDSKSQALQDLIVGKISPVSGEIAPDSFPRGGNFRPTTPTKGPPAARGMVRSPTMRGFAAALSAMSEEPLKPCATVSAASKLEEPAAPPLASGDLGASLTISGDGVSEQVGVANIPPPVGSLPPTVGDVGLALDHVDLLAHHDISDELQRKERIMISGRVEFEDTKYESGQKRPSTPRPTIQIRKMTEEEKERYASFKHRRLLDLAPDSESRRP